MCGNTPDCNIICQGGLIDETSINKNKLQNSTTLLGLERSIDLDNGLKRNN